MQELLTKIDKAKTDRVALDALLREYMPFIRQEAGKQAMWGTEYDDCVSIGMLTFVNCVQQYQADRGNFLSYVTVSIRNGIIDESRRQARATQNTIPLEGEDGAGSVVSFQEKAALNAYARQLERYSMAEEIYLLSAQLEGFGIEFGNLDEMCPKHTRLRKQCIKAAHALAQDDHQAQRLVETKRLPITYLAKNFDLPVKTLEKFRKYLITIAIILMGDYPKIREFVPIEEGNAL